MISSVPVSYLTLSYRWGPNPQMRLLSSNFETFRQGRPIADLPILFQDVMEVARQFSVRYVWIDALCIIQDSKDDWERESPLMRHVYHNSVCTIVASGSSSPDDSIFHDRDLDFITPGKVQCYLSLMSDQLELYYIYDKSYLERRILEGGLRDRGWAFQEWFLSPGILYFSRHQLIWECRTQNCCEVFPGGVPGNRSAKKATVEMDAFLETKSVMPEAMADLWVDLVNQYSNCKLTFPSDKLNAMAGIAKLFEDLTLDEYAAGLWKSCFVEMLDWTVLSRKPLLSEHYRAPSWSWASVDSQVVMHHLSYRVDPNSLNGERMKQDKEILAELVSLDIGTKTPDRMSTVLSARAVLNARVGPIICSQVDRAKAIFDTHNGVLRASCFHDTLDEGVKEGQRVFCMPLIKYKDDPRWGLHMTCLILDQLPSASGAHSVYRRLGILWLNEAWDPLSLGQEIQQNVLI